MKKQRRQMKEFDERLSEEAEFLNRYLFQYRDCISKKKMLEQRKEEIRAEFSPLKSPKNDGMPRGSLSGDPPVAALMFRVDEIEDKISEQMSRASKLLSDIINIIDFLPESTPEENLSKAIIENRYIDRMGWDRVCRENHCSRSTTIRYWKKGLYTLLEFKKVQKIITDYRKVVLIKPH